MKPTYTVSPAYQPSGPTLGESLLGAPPKPTLSFTTAPMVMGSSQGTFAMEQRGSPKDANQTDGLNVTCYVDFSEYYKAIEIHGEEYVQNSVHL